MNIEIKSLQERDNLDLLQLTLELYARSCIHPHNEKMHNNALEARTELEKRLQSYTDMDKIISEEAIEKEAEGRYPVNTHSQPNNSPYVGSKKTFIHGIRYAMYELSAKSSKQQEAIKQLEMLVSSQEELEKKDGCLTPTGVSYLNGLRTALKLFKS